MVSIIGVLKMSKLNQAVEIFIDPENKKVVAKFSANDKPCDFVSFDNPERIIDIFQELMRAAGDIWPEHELVRTFLEAELSDEGLQKLEDAVIDQTLKEMRDKRDQRPAPARNKNGQSIN